MLLGQTTGHRGGAAGASSALLTTAEYVPLAAPALQVDCVEVRMVPAAGGGVPGSPQLPTAPLIPQLKTHFWVIIESLSSHPGQRCNFQKMEWATPIFKNRSNNWFASNNAYMAENHWLSITYNNMLVLLHEHFNHPHRKARLLDVADQGLRPRKAKPCCREDDIMKKIILAYHGKNNNNNISSVAESTILRSVALIAFQRCTSYQIHPLARHTDACQCWSRCTRIPRILATWLVKVSHTKKAKFVDC